MVRLQGSGESSRFLLGGDKFRSETSPKDVQALQTTLNGSYRSISILFADVRYSAKVDAYVRAGLQRLAYFIPRTAAPQNGVGEYHPLATFSPVCVGSFAESEPEYKSHSKLDSRSEVRRLCRLARQEPKSTFAQGHC